MTLTIASNLVPLRLDSGGTYRVGRTRVRLDTVVFAYNAGSSAEQIAQDFPGLELADVHSVIGYYLHHRNEVDAYLAQRERDAAALRRIMEAEGRLTSPEKMAEIKRRYEERQSRRG